MKKLLSICCIILIVYSLGLMCFADLFDANKNVSDTCDLLSDDTELYLSELTFENGSKIFVCTADDMVSAKDKSETIFKSEELGSKDILIVINSQKGDYCIKLGNSFGEFITTDEIKSMLTADFEPSFNNANIDNAVVKFVESLSTKVEAIEFPAEESNQISSEHANVFVVIIIVFFAIVLILIVGIILLRQHNIRKAKQRRRRQAMMRARMNSTPVRAPQPKIQQTPKNTIDIDFGEE